MKFSPLLPPRIILEIPEGSKNACRAERGGFDKRRRDPPMGHPDYPLQEFANNLANVEEKYAKEIQGLVECFCGSRVDLPVKKLDELAKARMKTAKQLRKVEDKKGELYTLWKLCNIYSAVAVDVDEAMREIRGNLRKKIRSPGQKDPSPFRKMIDEYRPVNKQRAPEPPTEVYDSGRPSLREKGGFRGLFWKKETRKNSAVQDVEQNYPAPVNLAEAVKANYRSEVKPSVLPPKPPSIPPITQPEPAFAPSFTIPPSETIFANKAFEMIDDTPAVRIRTAATKTKVEETKRLSMPPISSEPETVIKAKNAHLPPVAPPRKEKAEGSTAKKEIQQGQQGKKSPALPPRPRDESWRKDMNKVQPTVIQLDGRVPAPQTLQYQQFSSTNPFASVAGKVENATNIQVEDAQQPTIPPSPQTTIRIRSTDAVAMSPKVSNGRVQKFQPESVPGRPLQQGRIIFGTGTSVDRF